MGRGHETAAAMPALLLSAMVLALSLGRADSEADGDSTSSCAGAAGAQQGVAMSTLALRAQISNMEEQSQLRSAQATSVEEHEQLRDWKQHYEIKYGPALGELQVDEVDRANLHAKS